MNFGLAKTTEPPGQTPLVVNRVVVGPFEEEEMGTAIASDVVKVKNEDLATSDCSREDRVRRSVGDSKSWVRAPLPCEETPVP